MNFFQSLLHPDRDEDPDRAAVVHAANLLQIGEFQLLQLAFADWHGREMTEDEQTAYFRAFFLQNRIPAFLRHYARRITELEASGNLAADSRSYHRYDREGSRAVVPDGMRKFIVASTIIAGLLGGGIAMASYTVKRDGACAGMLPPCIARSDLPATAAGD